MCGLKKLFYASAESKHDSNIPSPSIWRTHKYSSCIDSSRRKNPADGAQQGPSAMPSLRGGGSCTPSVVQSQGYADHVVVRETTKQALLHSILKKQALKQEVERRTCTPTPRPMRRNKT
jgi:hypothetical protein